MRISSHRICIWFAWSLKSLLQHLYMYFGFGESITSFFCKNFKTIYNASTLSKCSSEWHWHVMVLFLEHKSAAFVFSVTLLKIIDSINMFIPNIYPNNCWVNLRQNLMRFSMNCWNLSTIYLQAVTLKKINFLKKISSTWPCSLVYQYNTLLFLCQSQMSLFWNQDA